MHKIRKNHWDRGGRMWTWKGMRLRPCAVPPGGRVNRKRRGKHGKARA